MCSQGSQGMLNTFSRWKATVLPVNCFICSFTAPALSKITQCAPGAATGGVPSQPPLPTSHRIINIILHFLYRMVLNQDLLSSWALFVQLPAQHHCSFCQAPAPPYLLYKILFHASWKVPFSSLTWCVLLQRNAKGQKRKKKISGFWKCARSIRDSTKINGISSTSLQNPLPWFFIQIKLHSA